MSIIAPPKQPLAAQADLVLLTSAMLRPPNRREIEQGLSWWQVPWKDYSQLLDLVTHSDRNNLSNSESLGFTHVNPEHIPTLGAALEEVYRVAVETDVDSWCDEYWRLFEGAQPCPLSQASYIRRDKGAILGDLAGFYAAFGWKTNPDSGERPDHLVTQLDFLGMLLAMAAQCSDAEQESIVTDALAKFAQTHMHDWLPSVCVRMIETTHLTYFGAVAQWITVLWMQLTSQHDWPIDQQPPLVQAPRVDPEDPYECGAPDLVNIQTATE